MQQLRCQKCRTMYKEQIGNFSPYPNDESKYRNVCIDCEIAEPEIHRREPPVKSHIRPGLDYSDVEPYVEPVEKIRRISQNTADKYNEAIGSWHIKLTYQQPITGWTGEAEAKAWEQYQKMTENEDREQ